MTAAERARGGRLFSNLDYSSSDDEDDEPRSTPKWEEHLEGEYEEDGREEGEGEGGEGGDEFLHPARRALELEKIARSDMSPSPVAPLQVCGAPISACIQTP